MASVIVAVIAAVAVAAVIAGSFLPNFIIRGALGRSAPFFSPEYVVRSCFPMEKIALDLPLLDLHGKRITLPEYFQKWLLLIFLRHLA